MNSRVTSLVKMNLRLTLVHHLKDKHHPVGAEAEAVVMEGEEGEEEAAEVMVNEDEVEGTGQPTIDEPVGMIRKWPE